MAIPEQAIAEGAALQRKRPKLIANRYRVIGTDLNAMGCVRYATIHTSLDKVKRCEP